MIARGSRRVLCVYDTGWQCFSHRPHRRLVDDAAAPTPSLERHPVVVDVARFGVVGLRFESEQNSGVDLGLGRRDGRDVGGVFGYEGCGGRRVTEVGLVEHDQVGSAKLGSDGLTDVGVVDLAADVDRIDHHEHEVEPIWLGVTEGCDSGGVGNATCLDHESFG